MVAVTDSIVHTHHMDGEWGLYGPYLWRLKVFVSLGSRCLPVGVYPSVCLSVLISVREGICYMFLLISALFMCPSLYSSLFMCIVVSGFLWVLLLVCLVDMSMLCAAFCDVVLSAGIFVGVSGGYERGSKHLRVQSLSHTYSHTSSSIALY